MTSPTRPNACEIGGQHAEGPEVVQDVSSAAIVSRRMQRLGERDVLGDPGIEVVADHEHVEVLVDRVGWVW